MAWRYNQSALAAGESLGNQIPPGSRSPGDGVACPATIQSRIILLLHSGSPGSPRSAPLHPPRCLQPGSPENHLSLGSSCRPPQCRSMYVIKRTTPLSSSTSIFGNRCPWPAATHQAKSRGAVPINVRDQADDSSIFFNVDFRNTSPGRAATHQANSIGEVERGRIPVLSSHRHRISRPCCSCKREIPQNLHLRPSDCTAFRCQCLHRVGLYFALS